jgi:4-amino-4-deoxy-L-arabinose transferase-like glycosyltransferase
VIRLAAALAMGDQVKELPGVHDQISYDALAQSLLAGRGYTFLTYWYPAVLPNTPTSFWSFLYPLYLVGVYAVFGYHPLAARMIQGALSGALAAWLIYRLGKRLFGEKVGLVAAALSAVYIYSVYYDAALMTESFYIVGILAMLNLALDISDGVGRAAVKWTLLGVVLGITTLLRQSVLPWAVVMLVWILWAWRKHVRWAQALIPLVIVALFIAPWTIRNCRAYGEFLLLNSNAGYAMYSAQAPAHGTLFISAHVEPIPPEFEGLNEAQMDRALMRRGIQFVLDDPGRYALLTLSRVAVFFKFWPGPESSTMSNISRVLSYALYLPFFLYGLYLSRRNWRRCSLLYLFAVVYSALHILTWASIRYRIPIDAALMPFAALAVVDLASRVWKRSANRANPHE